MKKRQFTLPLILLTFFLAGLLFPFSIHASSDLTAVCSTSSCTVSPANTPLFAETNIYPGYSVTQTITVENTTIEPIELAFQVANPSPVNNPDLASKITISIHPDAANNPAMISSTLRQLYNQSATPQSLGTISANSTKTFFWTATFDYSTGNEYQNRNTSFDLALNFTSDEVFSPTPTPTPTSTTSTTQTSTTGQVQGASTVSAPTCSATIPVGQPVLQFIESDTTDGQITLAWSTVSQVTSYAINFGVESGSYLFGTQVGNQTTYTVSGLQPGGQYYFQVLGINNCAPGQRSNEVVTAGTLIPVAAVIPPTDFNPGEVLGETTETLEPVPTFVQPIQGQILGEDTVCSTWKQYLPLIVLGLFSICSLIILLLLRHEPSILKSLLILGEMAVSLIAFYLLRDCNCGEASWLTVLCQWFWGVMLIITSVLLLLQRSLIEPSVQ